MIARRTFLFGTAAGALGISIVAPKLMPDDVVPSLGPDSHIDLTLDAFDPGVGTTFERAVAMFNKIPQSTLVPAVGAPAHNPILAANQFGLGICDDYSRVFSNMLRRAGIKVWIRAMDGHVGVDVFMDGRRVYIDPTQGYWIEKGGQVLSAEEISATHPDRHVQFRNFRDRSIRTAALASEHLMALINEDNWVGEEFEVMPVPSELTIAEYESCNIEPLLGHAAQPYFIGIEDGQQTADAASFAYLKRSADIWRALSMERPSRAHAHNGLVTSRASPGSIEFHGRNSQFSFALDHTFLVNLVGVRFDASLADPTNQIIIRLLTGTVTSRRRLGLLLALPLSSSTLMSRRSWKWNRTCQKGA
jgi:hypothetical protein